MNESEPLNDDNKKILEEGMMKLMEASRELTRQHDIVRKENDDAAKRFWDSLSYDDKCNAFHYVVSMIYRGDIVERGTYRYVLYDIFKFGPDMYTRGMDCGYMALHNSIMSDEEFVKSNKWMLDDNV